MKRLAQVGNPLLQMGRVEFERKWVNPAAARKLFQYEATIVQRIQESYVQPFCGIHGLEKKYSMRVI